jgi:extradiol dioxygenase family protein
MTHIFLALRFWLHYADQPRGHRTVYFADPEGNQLEIWAEIGANDNARKRI